MKRIATIRLIPLFLGIVLLSGCKLGGGGGGGSGSGSLSSGMISDIQVSDIQNEWTQDESALDNESITLSLNVINQDMFSSTAVVPEPATGLLLLGLVS